MLITEFFAVSKKNEKNLSFFKKTVDKRKRQDYNAIITLVHKSFKAMHL